MRSRVEVTAVGATIALIALVFGPLQASAQACLGVPQGSNGALVGLVGFPEGATSYSMGGLASSPDGPVFFEGSFGLVVPDADGTSNGKALAGSVAYEVEALSPGASLCPAVGVGHSWVGGLNTLSIPFGAGIGSTIRLGRRGGAALTPWAFPQFLYVRTSLDDVSDSAGSEVFMAIAAGATFNVGAFMLGGGLTRILEDDYETVFSVMVGAAWR